MKCDVTVGTHGEENLAAIKDVWARLLKAGYIYKGQYAGWFNKKSYHLTRNSNVSKVDINGIKRMVLTYLDPLILCLLTVIHRFTKIPE